MKKQEAADRVQRVMLELDIEVRFGKNPTKAQLLDTINGAHHLLSQLVIDLEVK